MSFADEVRAELYEIPVKKPCCRRALAAGLLLGAAPDGKDVTVRYPSGAVADYAAEALHAFLGRAVAMETAVLPHGARALRFSSPAAAKLLTLMQREDAADTLTGGCDACHGCFLRGAFLSAGTVNDPHKSLHLEFLIRNPAFVPLTEAVLRNCGYPPRTVLRENGTGLYYKDGTSVEDLITLTGAGRVAMEMMNIRFERQLRGEENRATNCLTKNIAKTVSAAVRQTEAIRHLQRRDRKSVV